MSIILDNAATSGELVLRGPSSGSVLLNIPSTDGIVSDQMFVFDNASKLFTLRDVPASVSVPTLISAFINDSGYQTASDVSASIAGKANTSSLAPVATSGSYNDLTNKPTIPTVPTVVSAFTNDAGYQTAPQVASAISGKVDASSLATVATTGSYTDLSNQPTASSLGAVATSSVGVANGVAGLDATGKVPSSQLPAYVDEVVEVATYSALPTTGSAGKIYVTLDSNKTYRWGGSAYVEISAAPGSTDSVVEGSVNLYFTDARAAAAAPVQSVAGKTGAVTLTASDVSGIATVGKTGQYTDLIGAPAAITAVSQLTNDSGYQTAAQVAAATAGLATTASLAPVATSGLYSDLTASPTIVSFFTNDSGYQTASDVAASIAGKANTSSLAAVATSGSYNDLSNKPTIPTVPTVVSAFTNDSGYITSIPVASTTVVGGVKQGTGVTIAGDGTISATGSVVDAANPGNGTKSVIATVNTTDATDTLALSISLADNSSFMFTADVVVKNGNGTSGGGYTLQGVVRRASGASTIVLIGGAMKSIVAEDVVAWDANATANVSTGAVEIRVKGAVANSLSWFVSTRITHIG